MKIVNYILMMTLAIATLCGCDANVGLGDSGGDEIIPMVPSNNDYIFFNTEKISSRGELLKGSLTNDFGVLGYKYPSTTSWGNIKVQASQNLYGLFDENDGRLTVKYENGVHSYTDNGKLTPWDINSSYTFYAWYPYDLIVNGGNVATYEGTPYITYEISDDIAKMVDVLTASNIDTNKQASQTGVVLQMKHRLSAFDIRAKSSVDVKALKEVYVPEFIGENKNPNYDAELAAKIEALDGSYPVTIKITKLQLTLNNLAYSSVDIPLNADDEEEKMVGTLRSDNVKNFVLDNYLVENMSIPYYYTEDDMIDVLKSNSKMVFIPQGVDSGVVHTSGNSKVPYTEAITAKIVVSYEIWYSAAEKISCNYTVDDIKIGSLDDKLYHYMLMSFTKSGLYCDIFRSAIWEEKDIKYEFE